MVVAIEFRFMFEIVGADRDLNGRDDLFYQARPLRKESTYYQYVVHHQAQGGSLGAAAVAPSFWWTLAYDKRPEMSRSSVQ